jgi:hypothetical protein
MPKNKSRKYHAVNSQIWDSMLRTSDAVSLILTLKLSVIWVQVHTLPLSLLARKKHPKSKDFY